MRILLIEDHARLAALIDRGLRSAHFDVDRFGRADEGILALSCAHYDALILDLGLPDQDGLEVLRNLRAEGNTIPILILTSRVLVSQRVEGLDAGADDYLTKPFAMDELVARLNALLRRPQSRLSESLCVGNITMDMTYRTVQVDDNPLRLSPRELSLIEQLMRRDNTVVPKKLIEDSLYGLTENLSSNSVEVLIHRLRKKLADAGATVGIHTIHGVGYLLTAQRS